MTRIDILRAIRQQGPARGQLELGRRVLGQTYTLSDWNMFHHILQSMLTAPRELIETKVQVAGTGHAACPVFEYEYTLLPTEKRV